MHLRTIDSQILHIAVPSVISNVTIPLLGLVDTAITGHLGAAAFIAAVAVGTSIFSLCYWIFSFLRMGTGGLTAQAFGASCWQAAREVLRKALTIAIAASITIIALQYPIADLSLWLMDTTPDVEHYARIYFHILVWGAPASLSLSAMNGWLIGMQDAKSPMIVAISQNVLNTLLSCLLVFGFGWQVEGVAVGTLVSQWMGALIALAFVWRHLKRMSSLEGDAGHTIMGTPACTDAPMEMVCWSRFFSINRDIFLRTTCLVAVMFSFTAFGARQGETTLAVNALLMQMFLLVSYVMDGFAYAGEALGGQFLGASDAHSLRLLVKRLFVFGIATSLLFCTFFIFGGSAFVGLLTDNVSVRQASAALLWVAAVIPLVSIGAFIYDGLFIGTTATRQMLVSIAIATAAYFGIALSTQSNVGLWLAFITYLGLRGMVQHVQMHQILRNL